MLARTEPACLVIADIADIAGYDGYLAGVELDHAHDILGDLIDEVVGALRPRVVRRGAIACLAAAGRPG